MIKSGILISYGILITVLCFSGNIYGFSRLNLIKVYPVDQSENMDLSGLDTCEGDLLSVSDKKDIIFKIKFDKEKATLLPYMEITDIPKAPENKIKISIKRKMISLFLPERWDWEGISCRSKKEIYLVSESVPGILKISDGKAQKWIAESLFQVGVENGFFQRYNAFLEGVSYISENVIIAAVEREPRGLLKIDLNNDTVSVTPYHLPDTPKPEIKKRKVDLSGLDYFSGDLYTLERNAQYVCKRNINNFEIIDCKDFGWVENDLKYQYEKMKYGQEQAEGVAVTEENIFIVLDNNGSKRKNSTNDRRSLLFKFEFPDEWKK